MGIWGWIGAIAAGWFAASVVVAIAWALGMRRILRQPPQPPILINVDRDDVTVNDVITELQRRNRLNGGA